MKRDGFTLVELLSVIAIVALLMGIIIPSVSHAQVSGKKKRAKMETETIRLAVLAFERDHLYMPCDDGGYVGRDKCISGDEQAKVIDMLCGSNKLGKVYLEVPQTSRGTGCGKQDADGTQFLDPWGQRYGILLDRDKDEHIDSGVVPGGNNGKKLAVRVGVFSYGVPAGKTRQDETFDAKRAIRTW